MPKARSRSPCSPTSPRSPRSNSATGDRRRTVPLSRVAEAYRAIRSSLLFGPAPWPRPKPGGTTRRGTAPWPDRAAASSARARRAARGHDHVGVPRVRERPRLRRTWRQCSQKPGRRCSWSTATSADRRSTGTSVSRTSRGASATRPASEGSRSSPTSSPTRAPTRAGRRRATPGRCLHAWSLRCHPARHRAAARTANDAVELVSSADLVLLARVGVSDVDAAGAASSCSTGSTSPSPASCWSAPSVRRAITTTTTNRVGSSRPAAVLRRRARRPRRTATGHTVSTSTCSWRSPGRRRRLRPTEPVRRRPSGKSSASDSDAAGRSPPRSRGDPSRRSRSGRSRRRRSTPPRRSVGRRPRWSCASQSATGSSGRRGPASPPRRTSSFSVKVLTNARGSTSTISCTWRRSSPRTRSALRTAPDRERSAAVGHQVRAQGARRVDGRCGGGHARDRLDAGGGHLDRELALAACDRRSTAVKGERHWFAVQTTRMRRGTTTAPSLSRGCCSIAGDEAVPEVLAARVGRDVTRNVIDLSPRTFTLTRREKRRSIFGARSISATLRYLDRHVHPVRVQGRLRMDAERVPALVELHGTGELRGRRLLRTRGHLFEHGVDVASRARARRDRSGLAVDGRRAGRSTASTSTGTCGSHRQRTGPGGTGRSRSAGGLRRWRCCRAVPPSRFADAVRAGAARLGGSSTR